MITYKKMDVTSTTHGIIGHGVNCLGLMGSGVALAIRRTFSKAYQEYKQLCENYTTKSELLGITQIVDITPELYIANCFTQEHCGSDGAKYASTSAIEESLAGLVSFADIKQLPVYLPKIGAGLGGLSWKEEVLPIIESISEDYPDVDIIICEI